MTGPGGEVRPGRSRASSQPGITINGKFLGGSLTDNGVHRTALNFSAELMRRAQGVVPVRLLTPGVQDAESVAALGLAPDVRHSPLGGGQAWEMLALPALTRRELLVNFCNLGPVLHPNSVVMIHDAQTLLHPDAYPRRQVLGYRLLWKTIGRRARRVLTVSEFSRQSLAEVGIAPLDKISVVHNGTDHILRVAPDEAILDRLGLRGRSFALSLGSLQGYKNLRTLFAAFHAPELAEVPLVVTGRPGRAEYEARGWTPPPGTIFAGRVSDPELRALYTAAATFLLPSETEGFGLPPVEAMHCGTPAIVARGGAMPEVCADGAAYVPPLDAAAWAEAVHRHVTDTQARAALIARGHARAAQLTWARAGDRLWSQLRPLL